jgi:tetratricopeptide (TPR) repeat protein
MSTHAPLSIKALMLAGCLLANSAQAQFDLCGDLANSYGPFDYRTERGETLGRVDRAHFPPVTEALISGKHANSRPGPDIDYTLRAYPNHHRALVAAVRLGEKFKADPPPGMRYTAECWLVRATRFRPDDTVARALYAQFLVQRKRNAEALAQLKLAETHAGDNPLTHYNLGLVYLEAKEFELALAQAHKALALGFPRMELKDQLAAAGKWREPAEATASAPVSTPAGTPASAPVPAASITTGPAQKP